MITFPGVGLIEDLKNLMPATAAAIEAGIEQEWHSGAQICVWLDGEMAANAGIGTIDGSTPMRPDAVNLWMSSGKPIGAVAVKLLEREGLLDLDRPVADYWPEFAADGKESITTRHLLTHTGGIRTADIAALNTDPEQVLATIANARIERDWIPGKRAGYHAYSGWQVIGELVHIVSGTPYDQFVAEQIFIPLGMESSTFHLTPGDAVALKDRFAPMYSRANGSFERSSTYTPEFTSTLVRPGGGLYSNPSDMVRFYRMMLSMGELDGQNLLKPAEVTDITAPHRTGMHDETFGQLMDWGLGVMFDNKVHGGRAPYGYGEHASAATFGHGGRESSTAFADPAHNLAVALIFNAMPGEPTHDRRLRMTARAIYEDLGLA